METSVIAVARTTSRGSINSSLIRAVSAGEPGFSIASETHAPDSCNENFVADSFTRRPGLFAENLAAKIEAEKRQTNIKATKRRRIGTSYFPVVLYPSISLRRFEPWRSVEPRRRSLDDECL